MKIVNLRALSRIKVRLPMCVVEVGGNPALASLCRLRTATTVFLAGLPNKSRNTGGLVDGTKYCNDGEHGTDFLNVWSGNGRR